MATEHTATSDMIEASRTLVCPKCKVKFLNLHELCEHQELEAHFFCGICGNSYSDEGQVIGHKLAAHRPPQVLDCFGCKARFKVASDFFRHFESGQCKEISPNDVARLRKEKLKFAEQLEQRSDTFGDLTGIYKPPKKVKKNMNSWDPAAKAEEDNAPEDSEPAASFSNIRHYCHRIPRANAHKLYYKSRDFQLTPDPVVQTYNAARCYNPHLQEYVCPAQFCSKVFRNAAGLTSHIKSPVHAGGRFKCIACRKFFPTIAGLISHMESGTRCAVRHHDHFRTAFGQLTGGIIDWDPKKDIFFVDEKSVNELFALRLEACVLGEKT
ncbi:hypothetical protein GGR50DRAFT_645910 [Xylaria sp. CBS 124048]|nr:hypothetical protein GGR50DRAFT_645910 [Xylaria sp. CBS 124048]